MNPATQQMEMLPTDPAVNRAIAEYFAAHMEEELLDMRWANEHMRAELERQRAFDKAHPEVVAVMQKAMRASA